MNWVEAFALEHWHCLGAKQAVQPELSSLMLTPRFRASSNVIFLIFNRGGAEPVLVAKVGRLPHCEPAMAHEAATLRAIHTSRRAGFHSIPRIVALGTWNQHSVLLETALAGRLMHPALARRQPDRCVRAVLDWLLDLGAATTTWSKDTRDWFSRLVEQPLSRLESVWPEASYETFYLNEIRRLTRRMQDFDLPLVTEHGDLSAPNLMLLRDGSAGVVDWELSEVNGLPAVDLFFFLTFVAFARRSAHTEDEYVFAFDEAFFGDRAWARPWVLEYAREIELPPESLTPLFLLGWTRYLAKAAVRLKVDGCGSQFPESEPLAFLRNNRYYRLWRHALEHAHQLKWTV
jgi:Phosphotransferase enzyme family